MIFEHGKAKTRITYETKCRRCGEMSEWMGIDKEYRYNIFTAGWIVEKMNNPSTCQCKKCGKETVQDVVSFGEVEM